MISKTSLTETIWNVIRQSNQNCPSVGGSQNNIYEESHDCSTDEPRDRNCNKPSDEDVPEQMPVNWFPGAQPSHGHHRSHLCSHDVEVEGEIDKFFVKTHHDLIKYWLHSLMAMEKWHHLCLYWFYYAKLICHRAVWKMMARFTAQRKHICQNRNRICFPRSLFPNNSGTTGLSVEATLQNKKYSVDRGGEECEKGEW